MPDGDAIRARLIHGDNQAVTALRADILGVFAPTISFADVRRFTEGLPPIISGNGMKTDRQRGVRSYN